MKRRSKKIVLLLVCLVLIAGLAGGIVLVVSGNTCYFEGEAELTIANGHRSHITNRPCERNRPDFTHFIFTIVICSE